MESQCHMDLVDLIVEYVKKRVSSEEYSFIQIDSSGRSGTMRVSDNYVPDVVYRTSNKLIIGEAKTYEDFERKHSKDQFDSYLKECNYFEGSAELIVAIPWQLHITAQNYFRRLKKKNGMEVEVIVLDDMGSEKII